MTLDGADDRRLALALALTAGFMVVEAVGGRWSGSLALLADAGHMLADTLALGLAVDIVVLRLLHGGDQASLNLRATTLHVLGDILGSIAVLLAAAAILLTGWRPVDPLASIAVTLLILKSAWALTRDAAHVLLEGAPAGLDPLALARDLERHVTAVTNVHHVHAWSVSGRRALVSLHARVRRRRRRGAELATADRRPRRPRPPLPLPAAPAPAIGRHGLRPGGGRWRARSRRRW